MSHPTARLSRRRFLSGLVEVATGAAASAAVILRPAPATAAPLIPAGDPTCDGWLTLGPIAGLTPGAPKGFPYARRLADGAVETGVAYALTHDGRSVRVLSNVCTHGGCRIHWQAPAAAFLCPCHQTGFTADGRVLPGGAIPETIDTLRPLDQFPARVQDGQVQVWLA